MARTRSYEFPNELILEIFKYLPKADRKQARLTNRTWGQLGAETLFRRVYFAPTKSAIERFEGIMSKGSFRKNVKELVYDGRLFQKQMLQYSKFEAESKAYRYGSSSIIISQASSEQIRADFANYVSLFREQEHILKGNLDLKALIKGLKMLRSTLDTLSRVRVITNFMPLPENCALDETGHAWYVSRCQTLFSGTLPPTDWESQKNDSDRDCRGLIRLFQALVISDIDSRALKLGGSLDRFPAYGLNPRISAWFLRKLRNLEIDCGLQQADETEPWKSGINGLQLLLHRNRQIDFLAFDGGETWHPTDLWSFIGSGRDLLTDSDLDWVRGLCVLRLASHYIESTEILGFAKAVNLQELEFSDLWLSDLAGRSWMKIAETLGRNLEKLRYVVLKRLVADGIIGRGHVALHGSDLQATCDWFLCSSDLMDFERCVLSKEERFGHSAKVASYTATGLIGRGNWAAMNDTHGVNEAA